MSKVIGIDLGTTNSCVAGEGQGHREGAADQDPGEWWPVRWRHREDGEGSRGERWIGQKAAMAIQQAAQHSTSGPKGTKPDESVVDAEFEEIPERKKSA